MDDVLDALDVTVVEVEGLRDPVCWVRSERVILLRAGLSDDKRDSVLDWALQAACRR